MAERPLPSYDGDEPYVFVSYSHEDTGLVYPQVRWLQDYNDRTPDIHPGMGIQFLDIPEEVSTRLQTFVEQRDPLFYDQDE